LMPPTTPAWASGRPRLPCHSGLPHSGPPPRAKKIWLLCAASSLRRLPQARPRQPPQRRIKYQL
jgi:hypothetical protein